MKKIIAIFSILAMFTGVALAQDPPKNTVKKPAASTGKPVKKYKVKKVVKAPVAPAKVQ